MGKTAFDRPRDLVPNLETGRLTLRGHTRVDLEDSASMWADPEVTRHIGGRPFTKEETWTRLLRHVGHWLVMGFGYWVVREKSTGRFVGEVGFADFKRGIRPPLEGVPEIGWVLATGAQGQGYATEAVRAALAWIDAEFGPVRTVCLISPENAPSLRVAEKVGYKEVELATYKDQPTIILAR